MKTTESSTLERRVTAILLEHGMDFAEADRLIERVVRAKARSMPLEEVRNTVQEVWLGLCKFVERGATVETVEGLLVTIAQRQAFGWLDRNTKFELVELEDNQRYEDPGMERDVELLAMIVREFLLSASPRCVTILDRILDGQNLKQIAGELNKTHAALRKGWSRCVQLVRQAFEADGGEIARLADLM